jgi:calpain-7
MYRFVERLPTDQMDTRKLITEKILHYERVASTLMADDTSSIAAFCNSLSPRSPIAKETFFHDKSPVISTPSPPPLDFHIQSLANQANGKLAQALELDEAQRNQSSAIPVYMAAAELYLEALRKQQQLESDNKPSATGDMLKRRLQQTLDRVEALKTQKHVVPKAHPAKDDPAPKLTPQEVQILKQSSLIASGLFLPWSEEDAHQLNSNNYTNTASPFTDATHLGLSPRQQERFYKWARPHEVCQMRRKKHHPTVVHQISPFSIHQHYVTDCSFIASLCICAAYERTFPNKLVSSLLYPQDAAGRPVLSVNGKYLVRLWFNGVARAVEIDDTLPVDKHGNLLCSQTKNNNSVLELWVCLIEKAYMKLCGGYDFPGSNSGVDLFALTGWIPERIHFANDPKNVKDFETAPERAWERILSASSFGDCLITVSTEKAITEEEIQATGLVSGHAYAVLRVIQTNNGTRLLLIKNPWAHQSWKGRYSSHDQASWINPSFRAEVGYNPELDMKRDDGVFWICWDDILHYFHNFHLSWNPSLFQHRHVCHGSWLRDTGVEDDSFNVGENPQYILKLSESSLKHKASVWILISRHVSKQEQEGAEVNDYLTCHIHRSDLRRQPIWYPGKAGNCVLVGAYTNNPHVLVRYDASDPKDEYLALVLSQYKKSSDLSYTLSCFSTESFVFLRPMQELEHSVRLSSSWTTTKSGGPLGTKDANQNPMFAFATPITGTVIQVQVSTARTSASNILIVPVASFGDPIVKATGKALLDTGKYRHSFVTTERQKFERGNYVILVSNYEKGKQGVFGIKVLSSERVKLREIV